MQLRELNQQSQESVRLVTPHPLVLVLVRQSLFEFYKQSQSDCSQYRSLCHPLALVQLGSWIVREQLIVLDSVNWSQHSPLCASLCISPYLGSTNNLIQIGHTELLCVSPQPLCNLKRKLNCLTCSYNQQSQSDWSHCTSLCQPPALVQLFGCHLLTYSQFGHTKAPYVSAQPLCSFENRTVWGPLETS